MQRTKKIPSNPNFDHSTQAAYDLLIELNIRSLPIDPFEIIEMLGDEISISSWSELKHSQGVEDPFYLKRDKAEAKTQIIRGTREFMIVYDDSYNKERIRWTIAHELGHILLGHLVNYEKTALNRSGLTSDEYGVLEVEAHWFAGILLSPHSILNLYDVKDSQLISFMCDISKESGEKCEGYVRKYRKRNDKTESILLRNFYEFFYKDNYLQSITNGIYKFYDSRLYEEFYKISRICRSCNAYIFNENQSYCHICGKELSNYDWPFKQLPGGLMWTGWPEYLEGKYYPFIETDHDNKVLFCPVCKNHDLAEDAVYCKVCGNPLKNKCLNEDKEIDSICRHCPDCGKSSLFNHLSIFDYLEEVTLPDLLIFKDGKYEDYIEYEYWEFIQATIYYFKRDLNLYSILRGSKAIIDEDSFIIFTTNAIYSKIILENVVLIIECVKKYGHTNISDVEVYYDI